METPAPVDLVPTEVPQVMPEVPYTPPTPAVAPPITNTAKEMAKQGHPVTQETYIKQTIQPGVGHANTVSPSMVQAPGVVGRGAKDSIQFLAQLYMEGNQEYQIYVDRMGPARHPLDGSVLPCGQIHILPPMPYVDIHERIRQLNGGGKYSMRIVDPVGNSRHTIQFSIDMVANPPISNIPNGGAGYRPVGMPPNSTVDAFSPANQTSDIYKIREAEQVARASKSLIVAEFEVEDTKRTINRRRQAEVEAEERKTMAPFEQQAKVETQRAVDDLKNIIRENQHASERRMDQIQQNFEKTLLAISANKPNDNGMMTLMATLFKGMSDSTTAMMTAILGSKNGNNENLETMKMISASNEKVTQMALQSARDATSKSDSLLQTLITSRLEHPENAVKQALDMRESGWKQATEMFERLERMRDNGNDDEVINPEGGFWGNLGNVILSQLQKLTAGGMKGGAGMALNALAAMMGKPAGTTQYSDAELKQASDMLMRQEAARRGIIVPPAPQPAPALPSPTQQPVTFQQPPARQPIRFDPRKIFDRIYETETVQAAPPAQTFQQVVPPTPKPTFVPHVEEVEEFQPAAPVAVQPPAPIIPSAEEEVEEEEEEGASSLPDYVNQVIAVALEDLKSGRKSHDWIDIALDKWDESFLQALAQAPQPSEYDISAHIGMIQQKADPKLFAELYNALVHNPKSGEWYPKFLENFQEFLAAIKEGTPA